MPNFRPPADKRYAQIAASATILPGGLVLQPLGTQFETDSGATGIAQSPKGVVAVTAIGKERSGITTIQQQKKSKEWTIHHIRTPSPIALMPDRTRQDWTSVSGGLAFENEHAVWITEGASGKVRLIDTQNGNRLRLVNLNGSQQPPDSVRTSSFSSELVLDRTRRLLWVTDSGTNRIIGIEAKTGHLLGETALPGRPIDLLLAPDGMRVWVTLKTGSLCAINVSNPNTPVIAATVPVGGVPDGIALVDGDRLAVSDSGNDVVRIVSTPENRVVAEIPLRMAGLEAFRGLHPAGLAYDPLTKWLLVAESGINAVGVIDLGKNELVGHLPVGWMPRRVLIAEDRIFVTNARGRGTGPSLRRRLFDLFDDLPARNRGSVSTFLLPPMAELPKLTRLVYLAAGMVASGTAAGTPVPQRPPVRTVIVIREPRWSFDELMGDFGDGTRISVQAAPALARFGMHGLAEGHRQQFSIQDAAISPNHHAAARHWSLSDNFHTDLDGNAWSGNPLFWQQVMEHLRGAQVSVQEVRGTVTSAQAMAEQFIAELDRQEKSGRPGPRFLTLQLPADESLPYEASQAADCDLALGRILEWLSHRATWQETMVFVTGDDGTARPEEWPQGLDHIDSHRGVLLAAGPWVRQGFISHTNSNGPGLAKTIFGLFGVPPMDLADATAASLEECFSAKPESTGFERLFPDRRVFDWAEAQKKP